MSKKQKLDRLISEIVTLYKDDTKKLVALALSKGITLQQIADALGTSKQNIQQNYK